MSDRKDAGFFTDFQQLYDILGVSPFKYDFCEFGTRIILQKKEMDLEGEYPRFAEDYILVSKHLNDTEYEIVKPFIKSIKEKRIVMV